MKKIISFVLVFFGLILLISDTDNMTHFYLSKLIGMLSVFGGAFLIPKDYWN